MSYKLFIDDERFPKTNDWVIARSSDEAIAVMLTQGVPIEIAFDHDLGGEDTSMRFIHLLSGYMLDGTMEFPEGFKYSVHSQNPIGAQNIKGWMDGIINEMRHRKLVKESLG